jgi:hypothetical protein
MKAAIHKRHHRIEQICEKPCDEEWKQYAAEIINEQKYCYDQEPETSLSKQTFIIKGIFSHVICNLSAKLPNHFKNCKDFTTFFVYSDYLN